MLNETWLFTQRGGATILALFPNNKIPLFGVMSPLLYLEI